MRKSYTMHTPDWDAIVLGVGGIGSAALCHLAARGLRVLGIERLAPGHAQGSSHGGTRAIRLTYFEDPAYVPLLRRAYALWEDLQQHTGAPLFFRPGILQVGPPDGAVIQGLRRASAAHGLALTELSRAQIPERFPGFGAPPGTVGLLEADAGYLTVEACVRAHAARAEAHGAVRWDHTEVRGWRIVDGIVVVDTPRGETTARRLVLTAGAWTGLPGLTVRRKTLHWFSARRPDAYHDSPVFLYELPEGVFYGFPQRDGAVKIAEHTGGAPVAHPDQLDRRVHDTDRASVRRFSRAWLPDVDTERSVKDAVCMYTMTADGHFCIGHHPPVSVVAGLSGHGFKFAPVLGEILADLVIRGETAHPIAPFSPARIPGFAAALS